MRIPVSIIVGQIAYGATVDEVLDDYPDLEPADIEQALHYSAWLTREEIHPACLHLRHDYNRIAVLEVSSLILNRRLCSGRLAYANRSRVQVYRSA